MPADGSPAIALGTIPPGQEVSLTMRDTSEALLSNLPSGRDGRVARQRTNDAERAILLLG